MHEHKERKAYLRVSLLTSIYSDKCPNKHVIIMDADEKRVEGTGEKLEVCVVLFDKFYNCVPVVKLFAKKEPEKLWPPPKPPSHPS
jgi:hypothetical protein